MAGGMVVVPASMVGPIATAARRKARRRPPHKRNPDDAPHMTHLKNGALSVAFGSLAAVVGMGGGIALAKAEIKSKGANIAANMAAGIVAGASLGVFDRTAGTIVAHNYMVAAGQWIMAPIRDDGGSSTPAAAQQALRRIQGPAVSRAVMENARARAISAARDVGDAEAVGFGDYERIQGIQADTLGNADDVGAYEALQGIQADTFGDAQDVGDAYDVGDADEMGDPFGDVDD